MGGFFGLYILINCNMKNWWIFSLLLGILFFALGCLVDAIAVEAFGALFIFAGMIGMLEKVWPEVVEG